MKQNSATESKHRKKLRKIVHYKDGKYYHPKSIPISRGQRASYIRIIIIVLIFLWELIGTEQKRDIIFLYVIGITVCIILQLLDRVISMFEEMKHITSRYDRSWSVLVKDGLSLTIKAWVFLVLSSLYIIYHISSEGFTLISLQYPMLFRMLLLIYFLAKLLDLSHCPLNDSLWLSKDNGLDYGSGMAYSFYHGYLKLVLPTTGTEEKNLKELMRQYEDTNGIKFEVYKLFILIPQSLKIFVSLENEYSKVEVSKSLPEKQKTVAGVPDRSYKNAVYKIIDKERDRKVYVSAEFATPLKTFKDVVDNSGKHSASFNKFKKDITLQFYLTLTEVLKSNDLHKFCELIYYEDSYQKDNQTHYYDVGDILLTRLKEMRNREKVD